MKKTRTVETTEEVVLPLMSSRLSIGLDLEHRRKGLLWYSTFRSRFQGEYRFVNSAAETLRVVLSFAFPAKNAVYDDVKVLVDGAPVSVSDTGAIRVETTLAAGAGVTFTVGFASQGLDLWKYQFGDGPAQVRDFRLEMRTGFRDIDFPEDTLPPTARRAGNGWTLEWTYKNLVTGLPVAMSMPQKPQPGPIAGRISYFAPVSLLFFFFVMILMAALRGIDLHPVNYFFLAASFFAFHLLLAYLVGHISIHLAFAISSIVSVALVANYLRLIVGARFAFREAAGAQIVYLVLFSYAFFFPGYTGLTITVGAIVTLFVAMQATANVRWADLMPKPAES